MSVCPPRGAERHCDHQEGKNKGLNNFSRPSLGRRHILFLCVAMASWQGRFCEVLWLSCLFVPFVFSWILVVSIMGHLIAEVLYASFPMPPSTTTNTTNTNPPCPLSFNPNPQQARSRCIPSSCPLAFRWSSFPPPLARHPFCLSVGREEWREEWYDRGGDGEPMSRAQEAGQRLVHPKGVQGGSACVR